MPLKKILVGVTLVAFLGSDFAFGIAPALGQSPGAGNGPVPMPSLSGNSDGFGRVLPGPSTTAPYQNAPQPQREPQTPYPTQRPVAPSSANICQPGGGGRAYQTVAVPRTRALETLVPGPQQPATTVTQVTVTQNAPAQVTQSPSPTVGQTQRLATVAEAQVPEVEELSRIEAAFNLDPVRQLAVPMGLYQPAGGQQPGAQQPAALQQPGIQQIGLQQQAGGQSGNQQPGGQPQQLLVQPFGAQGQAMLGPFGTPLRQYGYSIFAANVSTFAPVDDIPVGPDYVMGPGDDVTINVWGAVDSTLVRTVDRNGRIVLPKVGDLRIWGLTFAQADRLIRDELARYFRGFQTSVTMGRLRTVNVYVVGEVCQPGVYTLSSLSTVTNGLFSAGGPTKLGSLREVRLIRGGYQVARLDLYDFLQRGDRTRDYRLESGDTIFVPPIGDVVAVAGEVKRPAIYEVRTDTRLADVVTMAGGVTPTSYLKRVQVVRALPSSERVTLDVDLTGYYLKGDEASNPPVNGGDLVLIHRSDPRIYNTVRVEGAVKYPGAYELKPMMRISQLLPAEKLLPEAQPERVEIARRKPDLSLEIVAVNLRKAWSGEADADVLLKPLDEVTVRTELKPARTITLTGQLVRPGVYTVAEGERLSSVLERAGGYTDRAFLKGRRLHARGPQEDRAGAARQLREGPGAADPGDGGHGRRGRGERRGRRDAAGAAGAARAAPDARHQGGGRAHGRPPRCPRQAQGHRGRRRRHRGRHARGAGAAPVGPRARLGPQLDVGPVQAGRQRRLLHQSRRRALQGGRQEGSPHREGRRLGRLELHQHPGRRARRLDHRAAQGGGEDPDPADDPRYRPDARLGPPRPGGSGGAVLKSRGHALLR